jgi:hypothetical protein
MGRGLHCALAIADTPMATTAASEIADNIRVTFIG